MEYKHHNRQEEEGVCIGIYNWRGRCVSSHLKGMGPTVYEKVTIGDGGDFQRLMLCIGIKYHCYPLTQITIIAPYYKPI